MGTFGNGHREIDPSTFQNDMTTFQIKDDVLTFLVHLGDLTYDKKLPQSIIKQHLLRICRCGLFAKEGDERTGTGNRTEMGEVCGRHH